MPQLQVFFIAMPATLLSVMMMMGLRGTSAGRPDLARLEDWTEYLHIIDERLADALDLLAAQVEAGTLDLRPARETTR